jgi:hypothetical protein
MGMKELLIFDWRLLIQPSPSISNQQSEIDNSHGKVSHFSPNLLIIFASPCRVMPRAWAARAR